MQESNCNNWLELPDIPEFKEYNEIYAIVKHLPLYKRKGKEEVFLGIRKSKNKNWIGWEYITSIRKNENFDKLLIELGLYELAINFWVMQAHNGSEVSFEILSKNYII